MRPHGVARYRDNRGTMKPTTVRATAKYALLMLAVGVVPELFAWQSPGVVAAVLVAIAVSAVVAFAIARRAADRWTERVVVYGAPAVPSRYRSHTPLRHASVFDARPRAPGLGMTSPA